MATFLFVHGGGLGGWCWKKVKTYLENDGHSVYTPTLTGLGERKHLLNSTIDLQMHIQDIENIIEYENLENIILVGHSYGGMVLSGITQKLHSRIAQYIYLDALFPRDGESMFDCLGNQLAQHLKANVIVVKDTPVVCTPPIEMYKLGDIQDEEWVAPRLTPHPLLCFTQPVQRTAPSIDVQNIVFIKCSKDHALDSMAIRAREKNIACYTFDSGHFPMITDSQKLCELLLQVSFLKA